MTQSINSRLDWLRFSAAFIVLIGHTRGMLFVDYASLPEDSVNIITFIFFSITRIGHEAVIIFFVLSGYFVGGKLIEKVREGRFDPVRYTFDRAARILVPFVPALAFSVWVSVITENDISIGNVIANLFFLQGVLVNAISVNGPLWSLAYEAWFYVLGGVFSLYFMNKLHENRTSTCTTLILLTSLCIFSVLNSFYLLVWLIGAVTYVYSGGLLKRNVIIFSSIFIVSGIAISQLTSNTVSGLALTNDSGESIRQLGLCILAIGISIFIKKISYSDSDNEAIKVLGNKLASFSYTMYLIHYPFIILLQYFGLEVQKEISIDTVAIYFSVIIGAMLFSYLFYYIFERNTYALKKKVTNRLYKKTIPT